MCGSIKDEILDMEYITDEALRYLSQNYPNLLIEGYNLSELSENPIEILEAIGKKRGCILKGGVVDLDRVRTILMNELRSMKIGAMSYEKPERSN